MIVGIAFAFLFGLAGTVYLSLRSSEVKVPDVVGKDRLAAENALQSAGLNIRVRATRPSAEAKPDMVLIQVPRAGDVVKEGQTVAVDVSRVPKEGEASVSLASAENKPDGNKQPENSNANAGDSGAVKDENRNANQNQNQNQNQNKSKRNKNTNSNSKNSNNSNNGNTAGNGNRGANNNANNRNANQGLNRNTNTGNRNAGLNVNRNNGNNANVNRRAPATSTPPFVKPRP